MKPYNERHKRCRQLRLIHDLTEKDVCNLLGVGPMTLYRYERGKFSEDMGPAMRKIDEFYKTLQAVEVKADEEMV